MRLFFGGGGGGEGGRLFSGGLIFRRGISLPEMYGISN